jgi:hypothetical protein
MGQTLYLTAENAVFLIQTHGDVGRGRCEKIGKANQAEISPKFYNCGSLEVEVTSISKQRIELKFFILSSLPEKVPL